jgi:hypothetical protein
MFWATLSDTDKSPFNPCYSLSSIISYSYIRRRFCLPSAFTLVSCSASFLTLYTDVACSSETSVHFQRTILRYIPEDRTLKVLAYIEEHKVSTRITFPTPSYNSLASIKPSPPFRIIHVNRIPTSQTVYQG